MLVRLLRTGFLLALTLASTIACGRARPAARPPGEASAPRASANAPAASVEGAGPSGTAVPVSVAADAPAAASVVIYRQPPRSTGGLIPASWRDPDGSDTDRFVWENVGFENPQMISEVRWRGGYDPTRGGSGGPVRDFTVEFYQSIPAGSEPDLSLAPLVHYRVGGNADETPVEVLGGVQTYDYRFVLPVPFAAAAATTYWVQIQAFQSGDPDWGLSIGTGTLGDGRHFRGTADGYFYQLVLDDVAIELLAPVVGDQAPVPEVAASLEEIAAMLADLPPAEEIAPNADGVQEVMLVVSRSGYTPIHFAVKAGVPVRLVFRQLGYVPGGNELFVRWGQGKETYLILNSPTDKKVLDFTPEEPGEYRFSCPHDWYEGVMTVRE